MLSDAGGKYTRDYELKRLGYDLHNIAGRVGVIWGMHKNYVLSKGRQAQRGEARSLLPSSPNLLLLESTSRPQSVQYSMS